MSHLVIACYAPKPGQEEALLQLVRDHVPSLHKLGMAATDKPAMILRNREGVLLEIFEWLSTDAIEDAHLSPEVQEMWKRFEEVSDYRTLNKLPEASDLFAHFEKIELN